MKFNNLFSILLALVLSSCISEIDVDLLVTPKGSTTESLFNGAPFQFTVNATAAPEVYTLPLVSGFDYFFKVDWGDGSDEELVTAYSPAISHTYTTNGTYTISISGKFEAFDNSASFCPMIDSVTQLGEVGWKSLKNAFYFCGFSTFTVGQTDTSMVTTMEGMFWFSMNVINLDLKSLDTSNVTNMKNMFNTTSSLTGLDISTWNTSKVDDMNSMFASTSSLTTLNLISFDTSLVTDMGHMFRNSGVTTLDLTSFRTTAVTNLDSTFSFMPSITSIDVNNWDISASPSAVDIFNMSPGGVTVFCNAGTLGAADFYGKTCN